jgi:type VI secretion system protein ImpA
MADMLDFDKLLKEISADNPVGPDLRNNSPKAYRDLKNAWERARKAERKLLAGDETDAPDWKPVLDGVPETIATQSKDLEMAAWLTEALVRKHGFEGLRDGLKLIGRLIEAYWDKGLHPSARQYGLEDSVRMVAALNGVGDGEGTLIQPINQVPLTAKSDDGGPFCLLNYQGAAAPELARIEKAEAQTFPEFRNRSRDLIGQCLSELDALDSLLGQKCKESAALSEEGADLESLTPSTSRIREALAACQQLLGGGKEPTGGKPPGPDADAKVVQLAAGPIQNREQAFQQLTHVAQYFAQAEPHSPISYALKRIVRWGDLPLPKLLAELIQDQGARSEVFKMVGIPPEETKDSGQK